jgi:uncharacterized RDD family membrane protein YckC
MTSYSQQQLSLNLRGVDIPLTPGTKINANEISTLRSQSGDGVVAEVIAGSPNASSVTVKNRSYQAWTVFRADGSQTLVLPGQSAEVTPGSRINFVSLQGEVRVAHAPVNNGYTSPPPVPPDYSREPIYPPNPTPVNSGGNDYNSGNTGYNPAPVQPNYGTPVYPPQPNYPYPPRYAGFWLRFFALIMDLVILVLLGFITGAIIGIVAVLINGGSLSEDALSSLGVFANIVGIIIGWLYYALMESSRKQATLGKMALGIYVTDLNGNRISFGKATGRYFGKIISALILYIGFIMAGFTEKKQALHDIMAGCLVLKK